MKKTDYYATCAVPKPIDKKKKKLMNGYKDKPNRYCIVCGATNAERHEIFGGSNRQHSIEDRLQIDLCAEHHRRWHEGTDPATQEWKAEWRRRAQEMYEQKLVEAGAKPARARNIFVKRYGFNLLDEEPR